MFMREMPISPDAEVIFQGIFRTRGIIGRNEWMPTAIYTICQNERPTGYARFIYSDSIGLEISKRHVFEADGTMPKSDSYTSASELFIKGISRTALQDIEPELRSYLGMSQQQIFKILRPYQYSGFFVARKSESLMDEQVAQAMAWPIPRPIAASHVNGFGKVPDRINFISCGASQ